MKFRTKSILALLTSLTVSCAHKTTHQYCTDADVAARYRDYDQCYQETSAKGGPPSAGRAVGTVLKGMGEAVTSQEPPVRPQPQLHCTSDLVGGYNCN